MWWVFKTLHAKGLVYRGSKVMPYSTACNTPLSNFEAGLDYRDVSDPAVMVAFPIVGDADGAALVAWTTTPWTLPSNVALCVHPELTYVRARSPKGDIYIVAESRLPHMPGAAKPSSKKQGGGEKAAAATPPVAPAAEAAVGYTVLAKMKGSELAGTRYTPLFSFAQDAGWCTSDRCFTVLCDTYVTDDSGTGIVHQAPAFGEDDFRVCVAHGVLRADQAPFDPTDSNGRFLASLMPGTAWAGKTVKDGDKDITAAIKAMGRLVDNAALVHSYPFCWRSHTPLIYKAVPSFFVRVEAIKERLLAANDKTTWVPSYVSEKRFRNWLENAHDWAVSRNRFWGTPIPVWRSPDGVEEVVIGSVEELAQLSGVRVTDLHRHFVDQITVPSSRGPGFPPLTRCEDVFDCWFESGSMPYAQCHYPFENKELFESTFPADFVAEGLDQTRGWFYTLMVLSTALFDKPAFKNLVCNGLVLAADGKKMSKSLRNYPPPEDIIHEYGADALRLYLVNSPVVRAEPLRFQRDGVFAVVKDLFLKWYNAYRFLVQSTRRYEVDAAAAAGGKHTPWSPADVNLATETTNVLDRWLRAACHHLVDDVRTEMGAYRLYTVAPRLVVFIEALCNTYVRLNRSRLKGKAGGGQRDCTVALATLHDVLLTLCKLMAPFTPFFTETMYVNLARALPSDPPQPASVHFCPFPVADATAFDSRIERSVGRMATVIELARVIRERHNRSVKVPVRSVTVVHPDPDFLADLSSQLAEYVTEEVNALALHVSDDVAGYCTLRCEPNWAALGKRLGKAMGAVAAGVKALSAAAIGDLETNGSIEVAGHRLALEEVTVVREFKKPAATDGDTQTVIDAAGDGDVLVVLDLTLDEGLADAGTARECVARVQKARKAAGLALTDTVCITLAVADADVARALADKAGYVADVLGTAPQLVSGGGGDGQVEAAIQGKGDVVYRETTELSSGAAVEIVLCRLMEGAQV